jgi:ABC-type cobalamin/Fe3+-siderophores transport system ATPase subunit
MEDKQSFFSNINKDQNRDGFEQFHKKQSLPPLSSQGTQAQEQQSSFDSPEELASKMVDEAWEESGKGLLPTFKSLQDRKTTFVFLFGRPGSGKTAIISSLCHFMGTHPSGVLEVRNKRNREGMFFLKEIFRKGREGLFLERTARNKITEIDLRYTPKKPKKSMNLTFLEMSGEDLNKVELKRNRMNGEAQGGLLPDNIDIYLKCPRVKMVFLLVTEQSRVREDDVLMFEFLDYLRKKQKNFRKPKVLLLVSKWDQYGGKYKKDIGAFVSNHMKLTNNLLTQIEGTIAYYTVGDVVEVQHEQATESMISQFDARQADVVKRWLYQAITNRIIPRQGDSWWSRLTNALNG